MNRVDLRFGDCLAVLRALPDASVDAIITDPPYGLAEHKPATITAAVAAWTCGDREHVPDGRGFMGRAWDGFVPPPAVWDECLRVLRPGGHLAAFAGSRTVDLMTLAIRLAGFEIRDSLVWLYSTGFPKSLDVSKAIDKAAGAQREVVGDKLDRPGYHLHAYDAAGEALGDGINGRSAEQRMRAAQITAPATEDARRWQGWGTALKPAQEPIVLARKPLSGTVAGTVLAHGTGGLNVDSCRVAGPPRPLMVRTETTVAASSMSGESTGATTSGELTTAGRWPANVLFTHGPECADDGCAAGCAVVELDEQSGVQRSSATGGAGGRAQGNDTYAQDHYSLTFERTERQAYGDTGGASRFFPVFRYQAKAPTKERPKLDGQGWPTVKPLALMRWLVRLLTPPGGLVLDPFAGTSATLQAAELEGFDALGCERDELAYRLSCARLGLAHAHVPGSAGAVGGRASAALGGLVAVARGEAVDVVLGAIGAAGSDAELSAVWSAHAGRWRDEYTAAARARLAELGAVAA